MKIILQDDSIRMDNRKSCVFNFSLILIYVCLGISVIADPDAELYHYLVIIASFAVIVGKVLFSDMLVSAFAVDHDGICLTRLFFLHRNISWEEIVGYHTEYMIRSCTGRLIFTCGPKKRKIVSPEYSVKQRTAYEDQIRQLCDRWFLSH